MIDISFGVWVTELAIPRYLHFVGQGEEGSMQCMVNGHGVNHDCIRICISRSNY